MSEEQAPFESVDMSEVKPDEVGVLSVRYVEGQPVLVVSGGTVIPETVRVVDQAGEPVAVYSAGPAPKVSSRLSSGLKINSAKDDAAGLQIATR
ncbi:hypothetical protein ACF05T_34010 [Streptomyces lateritius]|uniref:Flagellin N-terminal domain-containing protein n=1 Tax=Streptomyces lateritius TaxID=67313 RepID=A0ABW6YNL9_9ACTN